MASQAFAGPYPWNTSPHHTSYCIPTWLAPPFRRTSQLLRNGFPENFSQLVPSHTSVTLAFLSLAHCTYSIFYFITLISTGNFVRLLSSLFPLLHVLTEHILYKGHWVPWCRLHSGLIRLTESFLSWSLRCIRKDRNGNSKHTFFLISATVLKHRMSSVPTA